jgi:3-hydroxyisobutyrate dehydrogenase
MVDCPVSGGPASAKSGQLASMVGGTSVQAVSTTERSLQRMAQKKTIYVGGIGAGHAFKSVNNAMNTAHLIVATKGLLALEKHGFHQKLR